MLPDTARGNNCLTSVHLSPLPDVNAIWINPDLEHRWDDLLHVRSQVQGKLEEKRRDKVIGSSLEAKVIIYAQQASPALYDVLKPYESFLPTLFIVSQVELQSVQQVPTDPRFLVNLGEGLAVDVVRASGAKCERCWNYRDAVGKDRDHPTLCERCVEAVQ
jgi:isoleucyl-tRNA synthetase